MPVIGGIWRRYHRHQWCDIVVNAVISFVVIGSCGINSRTSIAAVVV
jgi:hypothetical protein